MIDSFIKKNESGDFEMWVGYDVNDFIGQEELTNDTNKFMWKDGKGFILKATAKSNEIDRIKSWYSWNASWDKVYYNISDEDRKILDEWMRNYKLKEK